jgi:CheY-like chemotaxis protein
VCPFGLSRSAVSGTLVRQAKARNFGDLSGPCYSHGSQRAVREVGRPGPTSRGQVATYRGSVQRLPYCVAIVDDEDLVRRAFTRLLLCAGYRVQSYASGGDFLHSLTKCTPHCVVLDLHMPQTDGFEIQLALAEQRLAIPVVVITGDAAEIRPQTRTANYLLKPVDEKALFKAVRSAIRSHTYAYF